MGCVCYHVLVCVLVGSLVWGNGWCEDTSHCTDPCKCNDINIQNAAKDIKLRNVSSPDDKYVYLLSLCDPIVCSFEQSDAGDHAAAGCQYIISQDRWSTLGKVEDVVWNITNKTSFVVTYGGGDADDAKVKRLEMVFIFDKTVKKAEANFLSEDTNGHANFHDYVFTVTVNSLDQGGAGPPVGYAGLVILLLLAIGIGAYFIIGAAVMYQVKGARGVEVIPNYLFWKSVPILIKDGVKFTFSPCIKKFNGGYEAL